jgi:hypothetical protein
MPLPQHIHCFTPHRALNTPQRAHLFPQCGLTRLPPGALSAAGRGTADGFRFWTGFGEGAGVCTLVAVADTLDSLGPGLLPPCDSGSAALRTPHHAQDVCVRGCNKHIGCCLVACQWSRSRIE